MDSIAEAPLLMAEATRTDTYKANIRKLGSPDVGGRA
jgi:hypothetical protein